MVPRAFLEEHIDNTVKHVQRSTAELVSNLDGVGTNDWEDRRWESVIAPVEAPEHDVFHLVSRRVRHLTLLACVSAPGDSLMRTARAWKPILDVIC
jgi:hypothetical protein